jgi:predicted transcriptional regulator
MASPIADFVVSMGTDGRIASRGAVSDALASNPRLAEALRREKAAIEQDAKEHKIEEEDEEDEAVAKSQEGKSGKLVVAEEIEEGHVSWAASTYDDLVRWEIVLIMCGW